MATAYEKQMNAFNEFVEDIKDRLDLIIQDGVQVVFTENSIRLNEQVVIRYTLQCVVPEVLMIESIKSLKEVQFMKNVLANYDELTDILKRYVTMFNHLGDFTDKSEDSDEIMTSVKANIQTMIEQNLIDGQKFLIKKEVEGENFATFYLLIENYGSSRKHNVDVCYFIETNEGSSKLGHYQIDKVNFPGDIAYQLVNRKCTHL